MAIATLIVTLGLFATDGSERAWSAGGCDVTNDCELRTAFGSVDELTVFVDGMFAVWWYPEFDHADEARLITAQLKAIRRDAVDNLGMADPPNLAAGSYYNIYIHHGADDGFPAGWGNGQGTDSFGVPFLTLPVGPHIDPGNLYHEGFHIFQYAASSPGFAYAGDSQWFIESAAQWYKARQLPTDLFTFIESGAITANPHLALWHSFGNEAPGDPTDWNYQVRQYGMHTYLYYLTEVAGVDPAIIAGGFYADTDLSPQEYLATEVGPEIRDYFADWAARSTARFDYLTPSQFVRGELELQRAGDPENVHRYVATISDAGTDGGSIRPPALLALRDWSFNVIGISDRTPATYDFSLEGDPTGSEGADSRFEGWIVVMGTDGPRYIDLTMETPIRGHGSVTVRKGDGDVFLVIAAVPEHFAGNQTYGYEVRIDAVELVGAAAEVPQGEDEEEIASAAPTALANADDEGAAVVPAPSNDADEGAAVVPAPGNDANEGAAVVPAPGNDADEGAAVLPAPDNDADDGRQRLFLPGVGIGMVLLAISAVGLLWRWRCG